MKILNKITAILIFSTMGIFFSFTTSVWSEEFSMDIKVPTQEVYIGEEIEAIINYSWDQVMDGTLEIESATFPGFEINEVIPGVEIKKNEKIVRRDIYRLTPATAGTWEIHFPGAKYINKDGKEKIYKVETKLLIVKDIPEWMIDQIDIKDIKKPQELNLKGEKSKLLYYILFLIFILILIYLYIRRKRRLMIDDEVEEVIEPEIDGFEEFKDNMVRILASGLINSRKYKEFIERLSHIFRLYISRKFKVPAVEFTSEEVLELISSTPILGKLEVRIINLLEESDLIKFAKSTPEKYELDDLINECRRIVELVEEGERIEIS